MLFCTHSLNNMADDRHMQNRMRCCCPRCGGTYIPERLPYASQLSCVGDSARGGSKLLGSTLLNPFVMPG